MDAQTLIDRLRNDGERMTVLRRAILHCFVSAQEPLTAMMMLKELQKKGIEPSPPSVYRELAFLVEKNIIRSMQFEERNKRYELIPEDHRHHLICTECKKIEDVVLHHDLDEVERNVQKETQFTVKRHALEFYGICKQCQ